MSDWRYDRAGALTAADQVLRVRTYRRDDGHAEIVLGWKGPTRRSQDGYKQREEIELQVADSPHALLVALGYQVVHTIDRQVEVYDFGGATLRTEVYPTMDPLLEVEGTPSTIERAIAASGIDRAAFTPESLTEFVRRFEARTGSVAVLAYP
jgi:adenylate cyclase class IV